MTKLINLTPHEVTLVNGEGGELLRVAPSGTLARVEMTRAQVGSVSVEGIEIPVHQAQLGAISGLPEPQDGVLLIVSRVVAEAVRDRTDVLITDDAVRDDTGRIIGCRAFARV